MQMQPLVPIAPRGADAIVAVEHDRFNPGAFKRPGTAEPRGTASHNDDGRFSQERSSSLEASDVHCVERATFRRKTFGTGVREPIDAFASQTSAPVSNVRGARS